MFVSRFRLLIPVLAGIVLLLAVLGANAAPASADGPVDAVHFFRIPQYYSSIASPEDYTAKMTYHGGPVMQTLKAYLIFWGPTGHSIPAGYQNLIKRYFNDIGGSSFYNILTAYFQNPGKVHPKNISTLGGVWVDTKNNYPHTGNAANPLTDADIRAEVKRAINKKGWSNGLTTMFFVFTAHGIESCFDSSLQQCTPGTTHPVYCAYHSDFVLNNKDTIYANMPYAATWPIAPHVGGCYDPTVITKSPNNNLDADVEVSPTSHEHFEAANDPRLNAWYDFQGWEIGDKCAYYFGSIAGNGSNLTLNGHPYIAQLEWTNKRANGSQYAGCSKVK